MPELTLTQQRQAQERAEAEAREARRKGAVNKPPAPEDPKGTGSFQMLPNRNRNRNDPSLRGKAKQQRIQSFNVKPGEAIKYSDQE